MSDNESNFDKEIAEANKEWEEAPMAEKIKRLNYFREDCSHHCLFEDMAREVLMTNLAPRIYALSSKFYPGCGFHYSLEQQLGTLIKAFALGDSPNTLDMNDYSKLRDKAASWCVNEVIFEGLCEAVIEAEEWSKRDGK